MHYYTMRWTKTFRFISLSSMNAANVLEKRTLAVLTILILRQFLVFKNYLLFSIRPSNKHSMREMEHFIPRAHLSREISYCFRQLLTPPPVREFSCNANVVYVRPTHDNCKSHKNLHTWSTAFCSPLTLLPVTCSSSLTSTILLEMEEMACVTGMSCFRSLLGDSGGGSGREHKTHAASTSVYIVYTSHEPQIPCQNVACQYHYSTQHIPSYRNHGCQQKRQRCHKGQIG